MKKTDSRCADALINDLLLHVRSYEDFLNLDVSVLCTLSISVRAKNFFIGNKNRITTIGQVLATPDKILLRTPNFGRTSLEEIRAAINELAARCKFQMPVTPFKNVILHNRKASDVLKYVAQTLDGMADGQNYIECDKIRKFANELREELR